MNVLKELEKRINKNLESIRLIDEYQIWLKGSRKHGRITFFLYAFSFIFCALYLPVDNYDALMALNLVLHIYILLDMRESRKRKEAFDKAIKEIWK